MIYVAPTAVIVGDVAIGEESSVWHGAVLRGDLDGIVVGERCSVQDNAVVHVDKGSPARIGDRVTVGHGAVVHGCIVGEDSIVGMNATVGSRARIGRGSIVAAGAVVTEGAEFPEGSIVAGVPARRVKAAEDHHRLRIELSWRIYVDLAVTTLPACDPLRGDAGRRARVPLADEFGKW